jgi:hypothetical protein
VSAAQLRDYFDATIECILDPAGYVAWLVPVVTARIVDRAPSA